ncbi:MAG: hypothetical protein HZB99_02725 [Candidatus Harrisonbacteria bacterium]|nr:hypothetical protein [Candidatus Harrisonbacteria bacterium]
MKQCELCAKSYLMGGTRKLLRGHYNQTNKGRKQPNLQWLHLPGQTGRVKACVKCLRQTKTAATK